MSDGDAASTLRAIMDEEKNKSAEVRRSLRDLPMDAVLTKVTRDAFTKLYDIMQNSGDTKHEITAAKTLIESSLSYAKQKTEEERVRKLPDGLSEVSDEVLDVLIEEAKRRVAAKTVNATKEL